MRDRARADGNDADGPHGPRRSVDAHQPPGGAVLRDSYGRVADDLRISITDRCNFRCIYCMPAEGLKWLNREDLLRFHEIARSDAFKRVMDGIQASREAGLWPIKLNMVVMKGKNDDEVVDFARLARDEGYEVRFIEFMPLDGDNIWTVDQVVPSLRIQEQIEDLFPLQAVYDPRPGPATRFKFADGAPGGIGFISSVSQAFCTTCNRIRLTAEGGLRTCLFSLQETPLRDLMRSGVSDDHLGRVIETAVWRKEEGHLINQPGFIKPGKSMSQIGG